jgi:hypothetical protein
VFDASPLIYGAAKALVNANKNQQKRRRPVNNHQHVVAQSRNFPGSYYVDKGVFYYRPQNGRRPAPPEIIEAGSFAHVDDLSTRLEYELGMMCLDIHDNYRHNPGHSDAYRQAYQVWQLAQQIQSPDAELNQSEVGDMVRSLDPQFQPLRREVSGWTRRQSRQHGSGSLQTKLVRVESLIHHLLNAAGPEPSVATLASKEQPAEETKTK